MRACFKSFYGLHSEISFIFTGQSKCGTWTWTTRYVCCVKENVHVNSDCDSENMWFLFCITSGNRTLFSLGILAPQAPEAKVSQPEVKEEAAPAAPVPAKEEPVAVPAPPEPEPSSPSPPVQSLEAPDMKNHEPHLGPRPRSHNRVLNPPGGKSSVKFYWWAEHTTPPCLCPYTPFLLLCFSLIPTPPLPTVFHLYI